MKTKNIILIVSIIVILSFAVVFIFDLSNIERQRRINQQINQSQLLPGQPAPPRPEQQIIQVPLSGVLLVTGLIGFVFYFSYNFLEYNFNRELSIVSNISTLENKKNSHQNNSDMKKSIINLLKPNERRIIKFLIDNHGTCLQSDISHMKNMGKVKAHRYLQNLIKMEMVDIERHGNTNRIILNDNFKDILINPKD